MMPRRLGQSNGRPPSALLPLACRSPAACPPLARRLLGHFGAAPGWQLTEKLAQSPNGAEAMCKVMNNYLTEMIDCISAHGGDIVKFAGARTGAVRPRHVDCTLTARSPHARRARPCPRGPSHERATASGVTRRTGH